MTNYTYAIIRLHAIISTALAPIICLITFLALAQTVRRHLRAYQKWLIPFAVGSALDAVAILLLRINVILRIQISDRIAIEALSYTLATIGLILNFYGVIALWRMVKTLPPYQQPTETADQPPDSQIWPPAPNRP